MKKRSLSLLVVLSCMAGVISARDGEAFVNAFEAEKAVWTYCFTNGTSMSPVQQTVLYGDTVIDGKTWKIINDDQRPIGFVRTNGQKVIFKPSVEYENSINPSWYEDSFNTPDSLVLYDFSLGVGDSIREIGGFPVEITGIDSVLLHDGVRHKVLMGNIEGLGSSGFPPFYILTPGNTGHTVALLICCHVNDELLYLNPFFSDCEGTKVVQSNELIEPDEVKIFADNGVLHVYYAGSRFDVALFDMSGMVVSRQKDNYGEAVIPLSNLDKGVYAVHLVSGNKTYSQKFYIK